MTENDTEPEPGPLLNGRRVSILDACDEPMTVKEIANAIGGSASSLYSVMRELEAAGLVEVFDRVFTHPNATNRTTRWIRTVDEVRVEFDGCHERTRRDLERPKP